MSLSLRAMLERREFGRSFDTVQVDLDTFEDRLPGLECPCGEIAFLASDTSFADLSFSVDCLLQHRKRLLSRTIDCSRPRRDVLILGAGPGGLIAAVELRLRNHQVIVCEQRDVYTRNRFMGVYKEVAHIMAALGMPEGMTYNFTHYRGKRGIMLADIQTFLHAVALKLGVIIYTGATVRHLGSEEVRSGEVELQRSTHGEPSAVGTIGILRWRHDTVLRLRSGVSIHFDTILEATGGRSGLRELLVGRENVVSIRTVAKEAALRDPSLDSCFNNPADHCAQIVESDYGCPPAVRQEFAAALLGDDDKIPDEIPCFVSNVDASIIVKPLAPVARPAGMGASIGDKELDIPRDWVIVSCPRSDLTLTRYQIEGPLPQSFDFGSNRVLTRQCLDKLNPVSLLVRILYAIGVPFDAIDHRKLAEFYTLENSQGNASDVVATWVGSFRSLRLGDVHPRWCGHVPGSDIVEYGIIGEALQNAWYRFGVGIDDTFTGALLFARGFDLTPDARREEALKFEGTMSSRSVQVLYHLYRVNQNSEQGVVAPVLAECYMDRRYTFDLAEAGLRREVTRAVEMVTVLSEAPSDGAGTLLKAALEHRLDLSCRRVLESLRMFNYDPKLLEQATRAMNVGIVGWHADAFASMESALSPSHREMLRPIFLRAAAVGPNATLDIQSPEERLVELASGRYDWATPWLRACAVRSLDPARTGATAALVRSATDPDPLIAETAAVALSTSRNSGGGASYLTIDKVLILREVSLFKAIPHETLLGVATLLTEVRATVDEPIIEKGDLGDCLYVIASGRVRVHDGDRTLRHLDRHQFFGELSLLDAEPRTASVSAVEPTCLFRLAQADFYALMHERPEIVQAINRVLCRMIRHGVQ
jgi:hypothetical protein